MLRRRIALAMVAGLGGMVAYAGVTRHVFPGESCPPAFKAPADARAKVDG